jgi:hypothetical protein
VPPEPTGSVSAHTEGDKPTIAGRKEVELGNGSNPTWVATANRCSFALVAFRLASSPEGPVRILPRTVRSPQLSWSGDNARPAKGHRWHESRRPADTPKSIDVRPPTV